MYRGADRRQKSPLDGATDFLATIWQHITTVRFVYAFILFFPRKLKMPLNMYELGLNLI